MIHSKKKKLNIASLFSICYLALLFLLFIDSYGGFNLVKRLLFLDTIYIITIFLILNVIVIIYKIKPILHTVYSFNSYVLLPVILVTVVCLTILEWINYPNFVYSLTHFHYDKLTYMLLLSGAITIINAKLTLLMKNLKLITFLSPFLLFGLLLLVRTWPLDVFFVIVREDNLVEYSQFFVLILGAIFAFLVFKNQVLKSKAKALVYFVLGTSLLFVAMDEISWGQRLIGLESPDYFKLRNDQKEITFHNLSGFSGHVPKIYALVGAFGAFSWIFVRMFRKSMREKLLYFIPNWYTSSFFFLGFVFNFYILLGDHSIGEWSEPAELMLYSGVVLFVIFLYFNVTYRFKE